MRIGVLVLAALSLGACKEKGEGGAKGKAASSCLKLDPPAGWRTLASDTVVKQEAGWNKWYGGPTPSVNGATPATFLSDRGALVRVWCARADAPVPNGNVLTWGEVLARTWSDLAALNHAYVENHVLKINSSPRSLKLGDGTQLRYTETRMSPPLLDERGPETVLSFGSAEASGWHLYVGVGGRAQDYSFDEVTALFSGATIIN